MASLPFTLLVVISIAIATVVAFDSIMKVKNNIKETAQNILIYGHTAHIERSLIHIDHHIF